MSAKSIRKNYIYNLTYQILTLITPFITTPYVSRVLGPAQIGVQSFAWTVSIYFGMFASMGIDTFGYREISYMQDDREGRTRVFWELKLLSLITSLAWLSVYITLVNIYVRNYHLLYYVLSFNIVGGFFSPGFLFTGMEEFGTMVARNVIIKIFDIAFIFLFIKEPSDLTLYVFGMLFFSFLGGVSLYPELKKYIGWPDWKKLNPFRDIKVIWSLFLPSIAIQIYTMLDKLMLGFFTESYAENGYYELALRIARMTLAVVSSLGAVVAPRIGYLFKKDDRELLRKYMFRSFRYIWLISIPMCLGLIAISDNFVSWFFGYDYLKVAGLLKISSFLLIFIGLDGVTGSQYLIMAGQQNIYTKTVTLGAAVNFVLNIFFIKFFQSYGALIASVAAEAVVAFSQMYFLRKEFSFVKIFSCGKNYFIAGLVMFLALISFGKNLMPSPVNTFILIFSGAGIYFIMLIILRDEFLISNYKKISEMLKKFHL